MDAPNITSVSRGTAGKVQRTAAATGGKQSGPKDVTLGADHSTTGAMTMPFDLSTPSFEPDGYSLMRARIRAALSGWRPIATPARRPSSGAVAALRTALRQIALL